MIRKVAIAVLLLAAVTTGALWVVGFMAETEYTDPLWPGLNTQRTLWHHTWNVKHYEGGGGAETYDCAWVTCEGGKIGLGCARVFYGPKEYSSWSRGCPALFRVMTYKASTAISASGPNRWQMLEVWNVDVHLWWPILLFIAYPAAIFIRGPVRRWRRRRKGWCIPCGYDLTGNESGVCPECGTTTGAFGEVRSEK